MNIKQKNKKKLAVIGLGYVGLPLAVEFGRKLPTIGYDIDADRIAELKNGIDKTLEVNHVELQSSSMLDFTDNLLNLQDCNIFIITVPTPIDEYKQPDLGPLLNASKNIGKVLKKGDIVIYESTVYPGATEEECVPILEEVSGLKYNTDFHCGYSPERINPGDKQHRLVNITKVTSGSTAEIADVVDKLYLSIIEAGTHKVSSIRVAEAAKVIENTQRDVNIGLVNEFALIFNKLGIDTQEVLNAARTKWNFLPFQPGLVGGHCIGVDPYYLTYKAQAIGYYPEIILAGRRLNDSMSAYVASQLIKAMLKKSINISKSKVLIMGLTFKENCPDTRNSKVFDIVNELEDFGVQVDCYDPWVDKIDVKCNYGIEVIPDLQSDVYDAVLVAVAHKQFVEMSADKYNEMCRATHVLYDIKCCINKSVSNLRL